jgi:hypothetical protein
MNVTHVCRIAVAAALAVSLLAIPYASAEAQSRAQKPRAEDTLKTEVDHDTAAIVVGVVVVTVVAVYLLTRKSTVTGCVVAGDHGMTLAADGGRTYSLSGDTAGVTPGNRMKLQGKKQKAADSSSPLIWETKKISKDYGSCRPQT